MPCMSRRLRRQCVLTALFVLGLRPLFATTIGTGQTVDDTSLAGQNADIDGTLTYFGAGAVPNYDTGAALVNLTSDFTESLGSGANQVQWAGSGGFFTTDFEPNAPNTRYNVNIGGLATPETLTWGQGGFVPSGSALVLDGYINFQNSINLGTDAMTSRQIDVKSSEGAIGLTLGPIAGAGNLLFQAYDLPQTGGHARSSQIDLENSVAITGTLELNNVTAFVGITNHATGFIDVANIDLTNGAVLGDVTPNGQTLRAGVNLTLDGGSGYGFGAGSGAPATQTLGQLNSTDPTTQLYLGSAGGNGTFTYVDPAALTVNGGYFAGIISDGTQDITGTVQNAGAGGAVTKAGTGILTLAGNGNTYTAGTTIEQGTLLVTNTAGSATGTGPISVMSGGALGGTGFVAPQGNVDVQSGGKIDLSAFDPSHAPAKLTNKLTLRLVAVPTSPDTTYYNHATFEAGASFAFDLGPAGASDELAFAGLTDGIAQVSFNNNAVSLNFLAGAGPGTYTLFTFDATGAYVGTLLDGPNYTFQYNANDITVTIAAPEPSAWILGCGAAVAFALISYRSRRISSTLK